MPDLLIRSLTTPDGRPTDLGIRGSRLIGPEQLDHPHVIDADGLVVLPGLVDLHTHLREPSPQHAETVSSGTAAAAHGGFTAVFAMANTDPVADTADAVRQVTRLARKASAEVIPIGAVTQGQAGRRLSPIEAMHEAGTTVFSDDGHCVMDAALMRQALRRVGRFGGVIAEHCQDHNLATASACLPDSLLKDHPLLGSTQPGDPDALGATEEWPWSAESVIVARDIQLAADTGARIHLCHVSTAESVEILRWAKAHHLPVTAEATPHHLLLDESLLVGGDTLFKVNPPLRNTEDRAAVRQALADGVIDIVGTDHAPHVPGDKDKPFPQAKPGMLGLEQALGVVVETMVNTGLLDWTGVAQRMSVTPARIGRIEARQGRPLAVGEPANLVLVDPARRRVVDKNASLSLSRNNPYDGLTLPDPVVATFWAGRPTWTEPNFLAQ
ncbi:MAG: dihydroorotase [Propionibacteriaceae bacterium]|jgi:dihydroorotase|nr:dihydroorotase [Propionibacteriaceae bacterium]